MDPREKTLKNFQKIREAKDITNTVIVNFLKELNSFVYEDIFIIGEKEDFTIKRVEGMTFYDASVRVLNLGEISDKTNLEVFEVLFSMVQHYHHLSAQSMNENGEPEGFKRNPEKKLILEYIGIAVSKQLFGDYTFPGGELEDILKEYGLIEDMFLIRTFAKKYVEMVEYEGDFRKLLDKLREAISIYQEIHGETEQDAEMLEMMKEFEQERGGGIQIQEASEKEKDAFLKNLLEHLSLD
ncbi:MAG: hypothetical protein ACTSUE_05630 [Promethearchaeota archaeon]